MIGATLVAARSVQAIYRYQSPYATVDFRPTRFTAIDSHLSHKLAAIDRFTSQATTRD